MDYPLHGRVVLGDLSDKLDDNNRKVEPSVSPQRVCHLGRDYCNGLRCKMPVKILVADIQQGRLSMERGVSVDYLKF